jgi:regulator of RNase E activity RraA
MNFPVFARGRCLYDSLNRQRVIDMDVQVEIDGVRFSPGDLVVADADGVVVIPRQVEDKVLELAFAKVQGENKVRDAIREGMSAAEAYRTFGVL